ncbi:MAG: ADP-heptose--LPS heptosyltransferase [Coxiella sp. (in: Bacteria)]|nr:MAG: ADP-heptose--LPS heptosyltransferase [Coxiella sp. (in: g-proteobacteria)]
MRNKEYILVIKHGALGDFIISTSAFAAIRDYHPYAHIVLLTTKPYVGMAEQTPYFDEVWVDSRPKLWQFSEYKKTMSLLRGGPESYRFKRVYDLQSSDRTGWYYRMLGKPKPQWVGKARGCSHPRNIPDDVKHVYDIFKEHLMRVGLPHIPYPNVDWMRDDISQFELPEKFVLLVPGAAPSRPQKRWTADGYVDLITHLSQEGITSVMLGAGAEKEFACDIEAGCGSYQRVMNLVGQTSLGAIATLSRKAAFAVGSDTGPMHIIAAAGCPVLVLFSSDSDPKLHGPRSEQAHFIQVDDLKTLACSTVIAKINDAIRCHT